MRAVDTNVLIRLIIRDDKRQAELAEGFIAKGAWISHVVLAEVSWVLTSVYELDPAKLGTAIQMLLNHEHLTIQDADAVAAALTSYRERSNVAFSDTLIVEIARRNGHLPLGTFDRSLAKIEGAERL